MEATYYAGGFLRRFTNFMLLMTCEAYQKAKEGRREDTVSQQSYPPTLSWHKYYSSAYCGTMVDIVECHGMGRNEATLHFQRLPRN